MTTNSDRREQLIWGWVRLLIGLAEISLAGLTFGVLITVGVTPLTVGLAVLATVIALISRLIYRGRKGPVTSQA